jgi:hypothetical protein
VEQNDRRRHARKTLDEHPPDDGRSRDHVAKHNAEAAVGTSVAAARDSVCKCRRREPHERIDNDRPVHVGASGLQIEAKKKTQNKKLES